MSVCLKERVVCVVACKMHMSPSKRQGICHCAHNAAMLLLSRPVFLTVLCMGSCDLAMNEAFQKCCMSNYLCFTAETKPEDFDLYSTVVTTVASGSREMARL